MEIDVFVSYHTDSSRNVVEAVVYKLEDKGIRCWYAPRDVEGNYAGSITRAIKNCKVFLLILNKAASVSPHVLNEIDIAFNRSDVIFLPFHVADTKQDIDQSEDAHYYLSRVHWIDGMTPELNDRMEELCAKVLKAINKQEESDEALPSEGKGKTEVDSAAAEIAEPRPQDNTVKIPAMEEAPEPQRVYTTRVFENGDEYTGAFLNDVPDGSGTMRYFFGDQYDGEFKAGLPHGDGRYSWYNGDVYEGSFEEGKRHGHGVMTMADGSVYRGYWKENLRFGRGVSVNANGDRYEGNFATDVFHGRGRHFLADGSRYDGDFQYGEYHGHGRLTMPDGSVYEGDFEEGRYHGTGKLVSGAGFTYEGEWKKGKRYGKGTCTWKIVEAESEDEIVISKKQEDGRICQGNWLGGHGNGIILWPNGDSYRGDWEYGIRMGIGEMHWSNGDCYIGEWYDDKPEGNGEIHYHYGKSRSGKFRNGHYVGKLGIFGL